jgi:hypothetical protein
MRDRHRRLAGGRDAVDVGTLGKVIVRNAPVFVRIFGYFASGVVLLSR